MARRTDKKTMARLASMEEEADKWRTSMREEEESGEARFFCPKCLVQNTGGGKPCPVCKGVMVPAGTPPEKARRIAASGHAPPPPAEGSPPPEAGPGAPPDAGAGEPSDAGAGEPDWADPTPDLPPPPPAAPPLPEALAGSRPMPQVRFCRNCGSDDMDQKGGSRIECRACGSVFMIVTD